jgi:hypothetical protein
MEEFTKIKYKRIDRDSVSVEIEDGVAKVKHCGFIDDEKIINNRSAIKKWKPILEALNIYKEEEGERIISDVDPYGEENWSDKEGDVDPITLFGAVYAEFHGTSDLSPYYNPQPGLIYPGNFPNPGDIAQNLLPVSMKVLSQLNLRGKNYELRSNLPFHEISIKIKRQDMDDFKIAGMDIIQKVESVIIQMLIDKINKELEDRETIYIESLAYSMSLIASEDLNPIFMLKSKYEII